MHYAPFLHNTPFIVSSTTHFALFLVSCTMHKELFWCPELSSMQYFGVLNCALCTALCTIPVLLYAQATILGVLKYVPLDEAILPHALCPQSPLNGWMSSFCFFT